MLMEMAIPKDEDTRGNESDAISGVLSHSLSLLPSESLLTGVLSPSILCTLMSGLQKGPRRKGAAKIATSRGQHGATHSWPNT